MNSAYFSELDEVQCFIIGNCIFSCRLSGNSYPILLSYNNGSYPKNCYKSWKWNQFSGSTPRVRIALWINNRWHLKGKWTIYILSDYFLLFTFSNEMVIIWNWDASSCGDILPTTTKKDKNKNPRCHYHHFK